MEIVWHVSSANGETIPTGTVAAGDYVSVNAHRASLYVLGLVRNRRILCVGDFCGAVVFWGQRREVFVILPLGMNGCRQRLRRAEAEYRR
jgi:hypothetical protein